MKLKRFSEEQLSRFCGKRSGGSGPSGRFALGMGFQSSPSSAGGRNLAGWRTSPSSESMLFFGRPRYRFSASVGPTPVE